MTQPYRDRSLGDGVYFAAEDYIGLGPRIIILIVDGFVLAALWWLLAVAWWNIVGYYDGIFTATLLITAWLFLVPLKRSRFRTPDYRVTGVRLVSLKGTRPSLVMLTFRSLLWMLGPFNLVFDLIWCGIDDDRQTSATATLPCAW